MVYEVALGESDQNEQVSRICVHMLWKERKQGEGWESVVAEGNSRLTGELRG